MQSTPPVHDVTVVVATRNRRPEVLASLPRHEAPVIVVDNASTDGTADAVEEAFPAVRVVRLPRNAGAAGRTVGARLATTELVAFADDDSWWAPGALAEASALMRRYPHVALVGARILLGPQERVDPVCDEMAASPLTSDVDLPGPRLLGFVACAAVVRRRALLDVGGFDGVVRFPGEEERVALDLTAAGWGLAYVDHLVVHHHPSPHRDDPDGRRAGITRSRLLTALLRRPWPVVARELKGAVAQGPVGRRAAREAVTRTPGALRARRSLPHHVEQDLRLLGAGVHP